MLKNWHQSFRLPEASGNCSTRILRITCGARNRGLGKRTEPRPFVRCPLWPYPWVSPVEEAERKQDSSLRTNPLLHGPQGHLTCISQASARPPKAHILARRKPPGAGNRLRAEDTGSRSCRLDSRPVTQGPCAPPVTTALHSRDETAKRGIQGSRDDDGARMSLRPGPVLSIDSTR